MTDKWDSDRNPLTENDRHKILSRLHSLLYWLGKFIPEQEWLDGEKIPLRDVIFQFVMKENPSPEDVQGAMALADALDAKARKLEKELQQRQMTKGEAHMLLDEICGLLRGVDDIRKAKGANAPILAKAMMDRVQDERRWLSFVKKVT